MYSNRGIITKPHINPTTGELEPVLIENEARIIYRNKISLTQVPNANKKVIIKDFIEVTNRPLAENEFWVDYANNQIWFNEINEGKTVTILRYFGEAFMAIDASAIATELSPTGDIISTLQKDVDDFKANGVDAIDTFNTDGANAITVQTQRVTDKIAGYDVKVGEVNNKIVEVNTTMDNMDVQFQQWQTDYNNATHTAIGTPVYYDFTATVNGTNSFVIPSDKFNKLIDYINKIIYNGYPLTINDSYTFDNNTRTVTIWSSGINVGEVIHVEIIKGIATPP